ncbi:DUF2000 domain-containing protein [Granulicella sp. dw_53]|uniref:DUF2000 domain-containing protein n=1 Tax=Granulicella sp. dw_53 TaxID=2719792 RepID=UPI001BD1DACC|nr:DUF2000 domain-containing protein [Granulicella sp. dw_53]
MPSMNAEAQTSLIAPPRPISAKCVIIVDQSLPTGLMANAVAVLGVSIGGHESAILGPTPVDASGQQHSSLVSIPMPILAASSTELSRLHLRASNVQELSLFAFSRLAQYCRTYDDYLDRMAATTADALEYVALALYGPAHLINQLTGNLKLVR